MVETNVDLQRERQAATICSEEFAEWWAGGREALQRRREVDAIFFDDPELQDPQHVAYMSHKELYEHTIAKATKFLVKARAYHNRHRVKSGSEEDGDIEDELKSLYEFRKLTNGPIGVALFQQNMPLRLHYAMFVPTLLGQGTEEQKRLWLKKAWHMDGWIGTYAQTELGHGTFLRGLETRADYDATTEEFVLNTPTLTAYKWWPGGMGQTANVVIVMAQLYVRGQHCGLQPFVVRIRNENTHQPEAGVDVGEIGNKLGVNGVNQGFLGLKDVRIPRLQMLMKNAQVLADGTFVKGPEPLLTYGTMVYVRVNILRDASFMLLQAATIATRYSAVRRQSPIDPDKEEPQILDHLTQQAKVLPYIAKGLCFRLVADFVWTMYQKVNKELESGNKRSLAELHGLTCCLKAVCTQETADGVEVLRKACGGHGYLSSANFSYIFHTAAAACTYEGENTVMLLQAARFLTKNYSAGLRRMVLPQTVTYLRMPTRVPWKSHDVDTVVRLLEATATEKVRFAFEQQRTKRKQQPGRSEPMVSNLSGLPLTQAATLHGRAFLARVCFTEVARIRRQVSPNLGRVLGQLLELFVLELLFQSLADVLRFVGLKQQQVAALESWHEECLTAVRLNAVAIVDGFDFHDRVLDSALGCHDGRVYERLMEAAKQSPLNQEPVNKSFHSHLKPFMQSKM